MAEIYDGAWRLFKYDPLTGRSVWVLHQDGQMIFRTDYPVESLIRDNAAKQAATEGKRFGDFALVSSIPPNVYQESGMAEAHRQGDRKFIKRFLNDSDNAKWRTRGGTV